MLTILGETLATGRYSFHGGIAIGVNDTEDDILPGEELIDPGLRTSTNTSASNSRPSTPRMDTTDSQEVEDAPETQAQKRHRDSISLQTLVPGKKAKISGVAALERMSEGIIAMAEAVTKGSSEIVQKDTVDSSLQGQAQEKVQEEGCLTEEGQLVMLDLLSDLGLARTYMAIKAEKLRIKWLKKQMEKHLVSSGGGDLDELFINWSS